MGFTCGINQEKGTRKGYKHSTGINPEIEIWTSPSRQQYAEGFVTKAKFLQRLYTKDVRVINSYDWAT